MDESGDYIDNMHNLKNVKVTTVKIAAPDGNLIELLKFNSHKTLAEETWSGKIYSTGLTHIALTVEDLDETYNALKIEVLSLTLHLKNLQMDMLK